MTTQTLGCILFATLLTASTFSQATTPADKTVTTAVSPAPTSAPIDLASVNLDRLQMRDGGLSCNDLKAEVDLMDNVYKASGGGEAGRGEMSNAATASAVGQVATGAAIQTGAFGALPLLGPLARLGTQVVMDQKTVEAQTAAKRAEAAKARKEHLTELFLKRDCKL
ncbi:MAG: hypothetical protein Q7S85_05305 [Rugosibacter sp.]|nr:hypothetical protein [Rugosibacter sp.]